MVTKKNKTNERTKQNKTHRHRERIGKAGLGVGQGGEGGREAQTSRRKMRPRDTMCSMVTRVNDTVLRI